VFNKKKELIFIKFNGPTSLQEEINTKKSLMKPILGQNETKHGSGYSTPLGPYKILIRETSYDRDQLTSQLKVFSVKIF
jgi:hypothetical protein